MKLQRKNARGLRALSVGAVAVSGVLLLTACGSDDTASPSDDTSSAVKAGDIECGEKGQLLASGSTAQKNAMDLWVKNYMAACEGVQVNYKGNGSGGGIEQFLNGQTGFAGSDSALKPEEVTASKEICKTGQGINLPMVGGPVAIGYNVPGVDKLVLDASTIAKIFDSKIKKWDDAAIKQLNPDATLPSIDIQAFHRSDESGTTQNLGKYLNASAADDWKYEAEKKWPAPGGQSSSGSAGVASMVKQNEGAIGYFELSYATSQKIPAVSVDTGAAAPVEATVENASAAIAAAKVVGTGSDLALELDYKTQVDGAYPIILVTYEIACDKGNNPETLASVKSFLTYTASEAGQQVLSDNGYAPLPEEIAVKVRETVKTLA